MKKYRVWGYEKQGYYIEVEANNKQDAHDKAMDVDRLDWEMVRIDWLCLILI